jgi:hypothetical protein
MIQTSSLCLGSNWSSVCFLDIRSGPLTLFGHSLQKNLVHFNLMFVTIGATNVQNN